MTPTRGASTNGYAGRVLCVTSNFPRWQGDSTTPFILHLAQDLQELGWRIDVLAPHAPGAAKRESICGVRVERFPYLWPPRLETVCYQGGALINLRKNPFDRLKLPALVFCEWTGLFRRLLLRNYDLLHSHWVLPQGFTGVLAARPLRIPHLLTVHGSDVFALRGPLLAGFKRFALRHADAVTVNSTATRNAVTEIAPGLAALHTLPMGVTETRPVPAVVSELRSRHRRGKGPLLVFVGRLVYEKGVDDLIHAVAALAPRSPDVTAVIVGAGQDRSRLEKMTQELGVADRVAFVGWVPPQEVTNYLAAADAFVGPSKRGPDGVTEAQGLTFIEAMLAGTPVIATRLGGILDAVKHEETGLLVSEGAPHEIVAAVERLVKEPRLAARLAEAGRRLAQTKFTRSASAGAFAELLEKLLLRKGR